MRVVFPCPLCRDAGRVAMLEADLDAAPDVVDLVDLCPHAEGFGELDRLTVTETWASDHRGGAGGRDRAAWP